MKLGYTIECKVPNGKRLSGTAPFQTRAKAEAELPKWQEPGLVCEIKEVDLESHYREAQKHPAYQGLTFEQWMEKYTIA